MLTSTLKRNEAKVQGESPTEILEGQHVGFGSLKKDMTSSTFQKEMLRGPVLSMICGHYLFFSLLLLLISQTHPYPGSTLFTPLWLLYTLLCVIIVEVCRLFASPAATIYTSFLPYMVFHLASRGMHMICGLFWITSVMTFNMQTASLTLKYDIMIMTFLFVCAYSLCSSMLWLFSTGRYYTITQLSVLETPIVFGKEVTLCVSVGFLALSIYTLNVFITTYATYFAQQEKDAKILKSGLLELQNELNEYKLSKTFDAEAPITKVITVIKNVQESSFDNSTITDYLENVLTILTSNQIYEPNIQQTFDSDITNWLNNMLNYTKPTTKIQYDMQKTSQAHMLFFAPVFRVAYSFFVSYCKNKCLLTLSRVQEDISSENVDSWDFDVFHISALTKGKPLQFVFDRIIERYGYSKALNVDHNKLASFLKKIESSYFDHPYHSSIHAADVLQAIGFFFHVLELSEFLTIEERFAGLIAAACHDVGHPGYNNTFMVKTYSPLSLRYNDQSVLESYHCALAFELMKDDEMDIFSGVSNDKKKTMRSLIIQMILATDMASHYEFITKFKNKVGGGGFDFSDSKDRELVLCVAMKCADISNPSRKPDISKIWSKLIMEEFWIQGDEEKVRGLPVSMFMDRNNCNVGKCQMGFIDFIVKPLYEPWESFLNSNLFPASINIAANREYWRKHLDSESNNP